MTSTQAGAWDETLGDLDARRKRSYAMGGAERVAKHRAKGKLDARARVRALLDPGSFQEFGTLVGGEIAADAIVTGTGEINGMPVVVRPRTSRHLPAPSPRQQRQSATASPNSRCATGSPDGDAARRRRVPAHRRSLRPHPPTC